jgi:rubrerythrin
MRMYKSPVEMLIADIQHQIAKEQDEEIYKAVVHYAINVDKEELIRALKYDRDQYERGYADGRSDAVAHGLWHKYHDHFTNRQVGWICTNCSAVSYDLSNGDTPFCPHCGAMMDDEEE